MTIVERRGEYIALTGLILQGMLFLVLLVLFKVNNSAATLCQAWYLLGGVGIWLLILVELYQHRLAIQQRQETEELAGRTSQLAGSTQSVFDQIPLDQLLPMERRLRMIKRWFVPIFSILVAIYLLGIAALLTPSWYAMGWLTDALEGSTRNESTTLGFIAVAALLCFVIGRYALGLSRAPGWRILRAGANYLTGNAVGCFALAITMGLGNYGTTMPERVLAGALPILMILLGIEIILNFVLDIYRPRVPGQEYRPCYESRLLGLFSEPGGIVRSMTHAIDYQFGFKVSDTWFYRLLQRAIPPLVLFLAVTLYALSCIVIVRPGQQAVITHWGKKPHKTVSAGLHVKWPWPIDKASIYRVERIQQMIIGYKGQIPPDFFQTEEPLLWTASHAPEGEYQILVASRRHRGDGAATPQGSETQGQDQLSPVNILSGALILHYKIDPHGLLDYVGSFTEPRQMLETIAYRQWIRLMASVDPMEIMTTGRGKATIELKKQIQSAADRKRLGIKLISAAIVGLHPPVEVANAFEAAINAIQERETAVWKARGDANKRGPQALAKAGATRAAAYEYRYGTLIIEQAKVERFSNQLKAYRQAPAVYKLREYLQVLQGATEKVRKIIIATKHPERIVVIIDNKEQVPPGLLGLGREITEQIREGVEK